jgi:O-antigen/teichoic acid export membrane protein
MIENDTLPPETEAQATQAAQAAEDNFSEKNLAASIGKNTFFGVIAKIVQIGTRLVTIPIVIAHLGLGGYGIWAIIMTAGAYMRFGSVGIKSAFQKYVAEATGNKNYESANRLLSTGTAAMAILSVCGLIPIAFFSRKLAHLAGVPPEFLTSAAGAISMLAVVMMTANVGASFEAIVMGAHRIDIARKFSTLFAVLEAIAIVIVLHFGLGLFAMATIMGLSELAFIGCCYVTARKIAPQIHVARRYVSKAVLPELFRYAGSYQMVNMLEIVYGAIVPIALLRVFGADAAGTFAIAGRLQGSAAMLPDSLLPSILSGGARVYASSSVEEMRRLIDKATKVTMAVTIFPLSFIAVFGPAILYVWTGTTNPSYQIALTIMGLTAFFGCLSLLGLVLYRVSGRALLDNIRQVLRIVSVLSVGLFAKHLGFAGVLGGLALSEFIGMVFMGYAMATTFKGFRIKDVLVDFARMATAATMTLAVGVLTSRLPVPQLVNPRLSAALHLTLACVGCLVAIWPALYLTGSVTAGERRMLIDMLVPRRFRPAANV